APSRQTYRLLARLEAAEKNDAEAARDWLVKAEAAPPDPAWVCQACGTVAPGWTALCPHCGAFDSLAWQPPQVAVHLPAAVAADPAVPQLGPATPGAYPPPALADPPRPAGAAAG